jgi:hypothetical protein
MAQTIAEGYAALVAVLHDTAKIPRQADFARIIGMGGKTLRTTSRAVLGRFTSRGDVFDSAWRDELLTQANVRAAIARTLGCDVSDLPPAPDVVLRAHK